MKSIQLVGALAGIAIGSVGTAMIVRFLGMKYAILWVLGLIIGLALGYWIKDVEDGTKLIDSALDRRVKR